MEFATKEYVKSVTKPNLKFQMVIMLVTGITGYAIIGFIDWRLAVGLYLIHFGLNIEQKLKRLIE